MNENSLAKRYASGLIKTIEDEKEYLEIKKELEYFLSLLNADSGFKAGMETFLFSREQKKGLLDEIHGKTKFNKKTYNLLLTMIEENRLIILDTLIPSVEELWFEKNNKEKLKVFSAIALSAKLEKKLIENLEKSFAKKIVLEKEIDKSLIAGIKIQRGSIYYDFSINGNLRKLKETILTGAPAAIAPGQE